MLYPGIVQQDDGNKNELPQPLQRQPAVFCPSMTEEPQWRLRNPVESEEEDEVEEGRNSGDKPPVEESSQAVSGQYSQANHQSKQGEKSSPSLDRTTEIPRDLYFVISHLY